MKNKKGFTLVELLSVIAILAILVIIALPNVIRMFTDAKKNAFVTEVQVVYKETTKKFISESSKGNKLSTVSSIDDTKLNMTGEGLDYCVILDNQGKVKKLAVGNNSYYIVLNDINDVESITKDDVQDGKLTDMKCDSEAFKVKLKCKYDGELKQGAEYINGQYTYRYMQESSNNRSWNNIYDLGWGVRITDDKSEEDANTAICDTINDIPIVSAAYMYYYSNAKQIDVSTLNTNNIKNMSYMFSYTIVNKLDLRNFNTSNVTNIRGMFDSSYVKEIIGISDFNTSNVTDMSSTFKWSSLETIDISRWDTSKVTSMSGMFSGTSNASSKRDSSVRKYVDASVKNIIGLNDINTEKLVNMNYMFQGYSGNDFSLSNFNTSNVTKMGYTFSGIKVNKLDLSSFNTSKVTDMSFMFYQSAATTLDLSSFNTSNVTNMNDMFKNSAATTLDLSSFNTSNVTNMSEMFSGSAATTLDLSNFDTSKVTNMYRMFYGCTSLKTIYVGNKFNVDNVSYSSDMFRRTTNIEGGAGTKYSSRNINKEYARIDGGTSSPGYFTLKNK
ncbi:MAG: BspA family leucine-rich repeat surface protein [Mollicutes bacterium]|nr:BspA family leucine-rich repeat surface protein [Mollicutes bacterium]